MALSQGSYRMESVVDTLKSMTDLDIDLSFDANHDTGIEGHLKFYETTFPIHVKKEFRLHQLGQLLDQKAQFQGLILVAENIAPNLREVLRDNGINYLDTAGNTFIKLPNHPFFILIEGKKPINQPETDKDKAFTNSGLKVVFHLLKNENLINENQRTIAKTAQVSLDTVNKTLESLRSQGFIRHINKDTMKLDNKRKLFDKWSDLYENRLKPKHLISRFRFKNVETQLKWRTLNLDDSSFWGGEPAADLITNYLSPQDFTLYTNLSRGDLMRKYYIIPDANGNIFAYHQPFVDLGENNCVHPLIAYADMLNSVSARNHEVAKIIETDYVKDYF
jgi:hypothetical protein